jgi:predicted NAD-dependent protein-ADP-ribosyltransferase YbiA (DUF1768 family)
MTEFVFYSKSADKNPGSGTKEHLEKGQDFTELQKIHNWRRRLSNMSISPFVLGGKHYASVEHFFHSAKFLKEYPEFASTFEMGGSMPWSSNPFKAKQAGKAGWVNSRGKRYCNKELPQLNKFNQVQMRADFYDTIDQKAMTLALYSKFSQNPEDARILLLTGNAKLYHLITRRGKDSIKQRWYHLERVRECIALYPPVKFNKNIVDEVLQH